MTTRNLRLVDEVAAVVSKAGATPAQVALAWPLAQGDDIAPIPGTKRVSRVEENTAADQLELSAAQIERLNARAYRLLWPLQSMLACMFSQRPCHLGRLDLSADLLKISCATDGLAMDRIL